LGDVGAVEHKQTGGGVVGAEAEPAVTGEQVCGIDHFRPAPGDHCPVEFGEVGVDRRSVGGDLEDWEEALSDLATERRVQLGTTAGAGLGSDRLGLGVLGHRCRVVVPGDRLLAWMMSGISAGKLRRPPTPARKSPIP